MKNLIVITSLLAAGTLPANAATTQKYTSVGNFYDGIWGVDKDIILKDSDLNQSSGFYTFETSDLDFSNLKSATFNIYLKNFFDICNLKIWAVQRENTDLSEKIAKEIIESANQKSDFVSISLTKNQEKSMLSIDIRTILQKITKDKDVAILIGLGGGSCLLDDDKGNPTSLSVEFFAVPEPSMFGLFAGTLALALAGTRRRRK